jgi:hypothetical protein
LTRQAGLAPTVEISLGLYTEPSTVDLRLRLGLAVMTKVLCPELPVLGVVVVRAVMGGVAAGGRMGWLPEKSEVI